MKIWMIAVPHMCIILHSCLHCTSACWCALFYCAYNKYVPIYCRLSNIDLQQHVCPQPKLQNIILKWGKCTCKAQDTFKRWLCQSNLGIPRIPPAKHLGTVLHMSTHCIQWVLLLGRCLKDCSLWSFSDPAKWLPNANLQCCFFLSPDMNDLYPFWFNHLKKNFITVKRLCS